MENSTYRILIGASSCDIKLDADYKVEYPDSYTISAFSHEYGLVMGQLACKK